MIDIQLRDAINSAVERKGAHCIDLVVRGDRAKQVIEVFIDAESGITTDLCADVSREISTAIDQANILPGPYRLDVSSPGIDRPLRFPWQYRKHQGRRVNVRYREAEQERSVDGTLASVQEDAIVVQVKNVAEPVLVKFDTIVEARIPAPW